jgi:hypothetical protein
MKRIVWLAAAVVVLAFLFPNGVPLPSMPDPAPTPVAPVVPEPVRPADDTIVTLLATAAAADTARIAGVYEGLRTVLARDKGENVKTTEKFAVVHGRTLRLAIDTPGKYVGLDEAIEAVFAKALGTDDVLAVNKETLDKLLAACDIIINSAQKR